MPCTISRVTWHQTWRCAGIARPPHARNSCSAEVNGRPRLMCKTRMDALPLDQPITVFPMKSFPVIKDVVTGGRVMELQG